MVEIDEGAIRNRLLKEEFSRDREQFTYTYDALPHMMTYPESHENVKNVIYGEVDYEKLPFDEENEMYKGFALMDQAAIVKENIDEEPLCEALDMHPCKKENCPLYIAAGSKDEAGNIVSEVPLCHEFKLAFKK